MIKRALAVSFAALLLSAACGRGGSQSTPVSVEATDGGLGHNQPAAQFVAPSPPSFNGMLTKTRHYNSQQIELAPPLPSMSPLKSPDDAFETCWSEAPCIPNRGPEILLALYTNGSFGQIQADGSVSYPHQNILVYVMTWRDVPFMAAGSSVSISPAKVGSADHVVFVDANRGRALLAIEAAPFDD